VPSREYSGLQGAGKSTLLNALLHESKLIPTSGMRACTASVVEIRYGLAGGGMSYAAEVHSPLAPRHAAEPFGTSCVAAAPAVAGGRDAAAGACSWWSVQGGGGWDRSGLREGGQARMCRERVVLCYGLQEGGGTVKYKAEITFISRAELFSEINQLIRDLRMPDGFVAPTELS
jgi:hypothetical protein